MTITASADGSALGNPGPAGWAWYVDDDNWAAGGWKHATNNQGELTAVLELFRATEHSGDDLLILCDSQYVINSVTKWMPGWKKKGWRKGDGKPVMNVELLQQIDDAITGRKYHFEWVRGHVGHVLNEAADARARAAAEAYQRGSSVAFGPGWTGGSGHHVTTAQSSRPRLMPESLVESSLVDREADNTLFTFDEPEWHMLELRLTPEEFQRLARRARDNGTTPDEFLRGLI
ncbi:MAG: RNase H family protein [Lacisediminihabitans sp.]